MDLPFKECPSCKKMIGISAKFCKYCKHRFSGGNTDVKLKFVIFTSSEILFEKLKKSFATLPQVEIIKSSFANLPEYDCIVAPGDSLGHMNCELGREITRFFGRSILKNIQEQIVTEYLGAQPPSTAFVAETFHHAHPFLAYTVVAENSVYAATWAIFLALFQHNKYSPKKIETVALPVFENDAPQEVALQMALAYKRFLQQPKWINLAVVEEHQGKKDLCKQKLQDKFQGALVATMLGDAFGLPFEFALQKDLQEGNSIEKRAQQKGSWGYSDDTEMMLGIAESLLQNPKLDPTLTLEIMCQNHEPARGYGKGMTHLLEYMKGGGSWSKAPYVLWKEGSKGNGAIPRVAPIACLYFNDEEKLSEIVTISARLTHAHPLAISGALVQGLTLAYIFRKEEICSYQLLNYLAGHPKIKETMYVDKFDQIDQALVKNLPPKEVVAILGNGVLAEESVPLALYAFLKWRDFSEHLCHTTRLGGDTDTICAISSTLCGAHLGIEAVPQMWLDNLEQGPKGLSYIVSLADRLCEKFYLREN